MQEDNIEKWLAASLRKQQEENPLPYELGAWEAFEQKRKLAGRKKYAFWISGIAASVALLMFAGGVWLSQQSEESGGNVSSGQLALEENPSLLNSETSEELVFGAQKPDSEEGQPEFSVENQIASRQPLVPKSTLSQVSIREPQQEGIQASSDKQNMTPTVVTAELKESGVESQKQAVLNNPEVSQPEKALEANADLPKEPLMSEEEIKEILTGETSSVNLAMGLSPGFGTSQGTEQTTSGSSLGLGLSVDMNLPGKLTLGSGLAVNYLNQASESQSYAQIAGFSSPVIQTSEISQVQVDIPLYVKYPITRNQSVSVQAGFSNLMTFNQNAEQQSSYTRQVAVLDASAANSNSFTLKSESVSQTTAIDVPQNKFYPFATANLGVNIRLYESKKSTYEVMPFYNYPLQEFSGYGEKLGMFGASFKVNFGAVQKK